MHSNLVTIYDNINCIYTFYAVAGGLRFLGYPAIWRDSEDSVKKAMFIVDPTQKAKRDGVVIGWNVYTSRGRRSQTAHLQIWRLVKGDNTFKLVGQTIFIAQWVGHNYFPLYPSHRIKVKAGDVVGLYFPKYNPIPWSATTCERGNDHIFRYNPRNVEIGREFRFEKSSSDWKPCRAYSINATLADTDGKKGFTTSYNTYYRRIDTLSDFQLQNADDWSIAVIF